MIQNVTIMTKYEFDFKEMRFKKVSRFSSLINKIKRKLFKYKIVNKSKYNIIPKSEFIIRLSEKEYKESERIYKSEGAIDYIIIPTGIGNRVQVRIRNSGKIVELTDYKNW